MTTLDKIKDLVAKRQDFAARFDEVTKKTNTKAKQKCSKLLLTIKDIDKDENSRRRTLIQSIRNIQVMIIEGYDMNSSKSEFDLLLKNIKPDYLDTLISKTPLTWVGEPHKEPLFEQIIQSSLNTMSFDYQDKYADDDPRVAQSLTLVLMEFRDQADHISLVKIEQFVNELWRPILNPDEKSLLDYSLDTMVSSNTFVNYLMCYLHYKLITSGSNQLKIDSKGFAMLKDKFFKILSSILI